LRFGRPKNTPDGRDVIELLFKLKTSRLLRPLNNPDGRDVIELEERSCD